jgi:hypothetical protein
VYSGPLSVLIFESIPVTVKHCKREADGTNIFMMLRNNPNEFRVGINNNM